MSDTADWLARAMSGGVTFDREAHTWTYAPPDARRRRRAYPLPITMSIALDRRESWAVELTFASRDQADRFYRVIRWAIERPRRPLQVRGQRKTGHHRPNRRG